MLYTGCTDGFTKSGETNVTNTAYIFSTPEDLITTMFGPRQHDAHVETRRRHNWLTDKLAQSALASLAAMQCAEEIKRDIRARRAALAFQQAAE
jgi:hypothetical protein